MILKRFLCCFSLKTGAILIGIAGIIFTFIILIIALTSRLKLVPLFFSDPSGLITKLSFAFELAIFLFISIALIIGAVKNKKWCLLPWLIVSVISVTGTLIGIIYAVAVFFSYSNVAGGVLFIFYGIIITVLSIYCWLVVYSLFQELSLREVRPNF